MRVVGTDEMAAIDAAAVARDGEVALMTRAGAAIARLVDRYAAGDGPIVAVAGRGNNGGDAYAALASYAGSRRRIAIAHPDGGGSEARRDARARALAAGTEEHAFPADPALFADAAVILDGILGVRARLPIDPISAAMVRAIAAAGVPVLALDVPTGVDPSTGAAGEPAVTAAATIALGRPKRGSFLEPGREHAGDLWLAPLAMRDGDAPGPAALHVLTPAEFAALLPTRPRAAEKRSAGAPLVIAGSTQFPGAAVLCGWGAARAGAGYVTVAAPEGAAAAIRAHLVEQVVVTYDEREPAKALETILDLCGRSSAIAIGPGLGLTDAFGELVNGVLARAPLPIVADASAFFHLAKKLDRYRDKALVLTPHAGEFARLSGKGTVRPQDRLPRLRAFVDEYGITTLLKGDATLIADRSTTHVNPTGTSALATAGTGDVLTGVIATLLAQGLSPVDAARAGAYWHGRAGLVAQALRPRGVIARDVADALGEASVVDDTDDEPFRLDALSP